MNRLILPALIITALVASRTVFHFGPNVEFITAAGIFAAWILSSRLWSGVVILGSLLITDLIIGNSIIFLFTWSGFLVVPLLGYWAQKNFQAMNLPWRFIAFVTPGIMGVIIFFLWTNFGVVITSTMYPNTVEGLIQSYVNAIPFLRNQLISAALSLPILWFVWEVLSAKNYGLAVPRKLHNHNKDI